MFATSVFLFLSLVASLIYPELAFIIYAAYDNPMLCFYYAINFIHGPWLHLLQGLLAPHCFIKIPLARLHFKF